jgi:hypothetical protein
MPAVVLRGTEVHERTRAPRVVELRRERRCEHPPQQTRSEVEVEILIGANCSVQYPARAIALRFEWRGEQQEHRKHRELHWVISASVMFVSRTVAPAGTSTQAEYVWNPGRATSS